MEYSIRRADINDCESILAIEQACFEYPWSRLLFDADLSSNPNAAYWVAQSGEGEVLGFIGTHDIAGEINITNVAVAPEFRGCGIAQALVKTVKDHFKDKDIYGITLEVASENAPAIHVYEKADFSPEGIRKKYYKNGDDAIIMWSRSKEEKG